MQLEEAQKMVERVESGGAPVTILAVVVIYRISLADCVSLHSLLRSYAASVRRGVNLSVLVVDNTPEDSARAEAPLPQGVERLACPANLGLANAYNRGIERAKQIDARWLITLDQDTTLPLGFIDLMAGHAERLERDSATAVILPHVFAENVALSPFYLHWNAVPTWFEGAYTGTPSQAVFFINSGAMLRVDALEQAGGYDPWFWLDGSDMAIAVRMQRYGKRVFVAGDVIVEHELSMKNMQSRISAWRYRHVLLAESALWDAEMGPLAGLERTVRLCLRLLKQIRRGDAASLRHLTLQFLLLRLFRTKRYRRRLFEAAVRETLGTKLEMTALFPRPPKLSVCMAAYNAGHYLDEQVNSILAQLGQDDELIIVDDHSTDETPIRIRGYADARIHLIEHAVNCGVVGTFEHALRASTGDILFLADNDDIWQPDKVCRFQAAFAERDDILVVMSAVQLIDANGIPFQSPQFDRNGRFIRGFWRNLFKNGYQGSAMALHKKLLAQILPLPASRNYLHDAWIGTYNDRIGGGMVFLTERLLKYRRHSTNVSQRMGRLQQLKARLQLLADHISQLFP